jgi:nuclear transcription Y subunit beta
MKNTLPENAKIAKDTKETVQECVSEFISFITSEASDKCLQEKRKTINGDDLLWAMSTLGFDKYVEPLKEYLRKYREAVKNNSNSSSNVAATAAAAATAAVGNIPGAGTVGLQQQQQLQQQYHQPASSPSLSSV